MRFEQAVRSHVGCRRKNNEDRALARPDLGLWAVADGMGGHEAGEEASILVVEKLGQITPGPAGVPHNAVAALQDANKALWEMGRRSAGTIGSTVVTLAVSGETFCCLWAGDSRGYLLRDGALRQLTHDHSLVQELVDAGDLAPEAAANHPNANIITRAVGSQPSLALDAAEGDVRAGDVFLLASDGLTRLMSADELAAMGKARDLEMLADRWLETALARGAPDNLTFVIVRLS